eukprot:TRINITY_DN8416_c0_g1_i1.p1 TRINITY_DN8416_c0_g1~~TRINITY_DN8416_c0_g1_i1.p1  ORF type:complete len:710 (-),score=339.00 TRINITY_DN8416_c0_g1_i1:25-2154(-)
MNTSEGLAIIDDLDEILNGTLSQDGLDKIIHSTEWSVVSSSGFIIAGLMMSAVFIGAEISAYINHKKKSKRKEREPGKFAIFMFLLELIDAIPEAAVIAQSTITGAIGWSFVISITLLNVVNTSASAVDFLATKNNRRIHQFLFALLFFSVGMLVYSISVDVYGHFAHMFLEDQRDVRHIFCLLGGTFVGFSLIIILMRVEHHIHSQEESNEDDAMLDVLEKIQNQLAILAPKLDAYNHSKISSKSLQYQTPIIRRKIESSSSSSESEEAYESDDGDSYKEGIDLNAIAAGATQDVFFQGDSNNNSPQTAAVKKRRNTNNNNKKKKKASRKKTPSDRKNVRFESDQENEKAVASGDIYDMSRSKPEDYEEDEQEIVEISEKTISALTQRANSLRQMETLVSFLYSWSHGLKGQRKLAIVEDFSAFLAEKTLDLIEGEEYISKGKKRVVKRNKRGHIKNTFAMNMFLKGKGPIATDNKPTTDILVGNKSPLLADDSAAIPMSPAPKTGASLTSLLPRRYHRRNNSAGSSERLFDSTPIGYASNDEALIVPPFKQPESYEFEHIPAAGDAIDIALDVAITIDPHDEYILTPGERFQDCMRKVRPMMHRSLKFMGLMIVVFTWSILLTTVFAYFLVWIDNKTVEGAEFIEAFCEGLSGGAFLSTVSGTMIFRIQQDFYGSEWQVDWSKMIGMSCFVFGIVFSNFIAMLEVNY